MQNAFIYNIKKFSLSGLDFFFNELYYSLKEGTNILLVLSPKSQRTVTTNSSYSVIIL